MIIRFIFVLNFFVARLNRSFVFFSQSQFQRVYLFNVLLSWVVSLFSWPNRNTVQLMEYENEMK